MRTRRKNACAPGGATAAPGVLVGLLAVLAAAAPGAAGRGLATRPGGFAGGFAGADPQTGAATRLGPAAGDPPRRQAPQPPRPPAKAGLAHGGGGAPAAARFYPEPGRERRRDGPAAHDAASLQTAVHGWCAAVAAVAPAHMGRLQCPTDAGKYVCCNNKCMSKGW